MGTEFDILQFSMLPRQLKEYFDQYVVGQDEAKKALATGLCTHYRRLQYELAAALTEDLPKSTIVLVGPTGTGKTRLIKLAAKKIGVPHVITDATQYTSAGYVGKDTESIIAELFERSDFSVRNTEMGLVCIDEFDKLASGEDSHMDIKGTAVQEELLKLIEGTDVKYYADQFDDDGVTLRTNNVFYVLSGAFQGIQDLRAKSGLGFNSAATHPQIQNMLEKYGIGSQLVGRISSVAELKELTVSQLEQILRLPESDIVKEKQHEFAAYGVHLTLTDDGIKRLAEKAAAMKLGGRGLKILLDQTLSPLLYLIPDTDVEELAVTPELLENPLSFEKHSRKRTGKLYDSLALVKERVDEMAAHFRATGVSPVLATPAATYCLLNDKKSTELADILVEQHAEIDEHLEKTKIRDRKVKLTPEAKELIIARTLSKGESNTLPTLAGMIEDLTPHVVPEKKAKEVTITQEMIEKRIRK